MLQSMVEDCKYVARIICGECGDGSVCGVHFRNPISLFADVSPLVWQSESLTQFWRHKDAGSATVDRCPYGMHLAVSVTYPNFMNNVR